MSDPLRTDSSRPPDATSEADREAKIEQLLLVGLDYYFASLYEQAINVWTRALFLDRSHARARAYIERARGALAERQRESEELLQTGVAAFHRGDSEEARRLLRAAIDGGAPPEEALALLDRLNRLTTGTNVEPARSSRTPRRAAGMLARPRSRVALSVALFTGVSLIAIAGVAGAVWKRLEWRSWFTLQETPAALAAAPVAREVVLPRPRRGETALARARTLAATGRLRDALTALDAVRPTDEERSAADRLRADIQRQLISLVSPSTAPAATDKGENRLP